MDMLFGVLAIMSTGLDNIYNEATTIIGFTDLGVVLCEW